MRFPIELEGVMEYNDQFPVQVEQELGTSEEYGGPKKGTITLKALNEGGYNSTVVDFFQLVDWIDNHRDLIEQLRKS